ncbi:MAG: CHASE domain-containing protein [Cellvibrionaceae bacterium]
MKKNDSADKNQWQMINLIHGSWTGWLILAISLSLTVVAYFVARNLSYEQERKRFEYRSDEIQNAITERMRVYEQTLYAAAAMIDSHDGFITRDEWRKFVAAMRINENWPGIQGLGFAVPVESEKKEIFEQGVRDEGFPEFKISPEGVRDEYTSIIYLEPFDWRNQRAFGYDMWSNEMRRQAMQRAREERVAAISGIITLVQETKTDVQKGFLMYWPVFHEENKQFLGWVYSAFRANDLMSGILGDYDPNIEFEIFDGETVKKDSLLFDTNDFFSQGEMKFSPVFSSEKIIELQGRPWTIYLSTPVSYSVNRENRSSQYVLIGGIIIDILLFYLIYSLFSINKKAQQIASDMTTEYRLASEREEQANRAKSQFLANMSHELRTPLNSIIGFSHRLIRRLSEQVEEREAEGLRAIHRNGLSLLSLINDILDLSKVEAGQMEVDCHQFDVKDICEDNILEWHELAKEKNIKFVLDKPESPILINSDVRKVQQIVRNLMSNAFKYTTEGSVVLSIHPARTERSLDAVEITVTDTGIGISEEDLENLFASYFRAQEVRTKAIQGTGLGLVITSQFVGLLGGEINVVSEEGKGSCFSVIIPAEREASKP